MHNITTDVNYKPINGYHPDLVNPTPPGDDKPIVINWKMQGNKIIKLMSDNTFWIYRFDDPLSVRYWKILKEESYGSSDG